MEGVIARKINFAYINNKHCKFSMQDILFSQNSKLETRIDSK